LAYILLNPFDLIPQQIASQFEQRVGGYSRQAENRAVFKEIAIGTLF
jgi:hypothetical protein